MELIDRKKLNKKKKYQFKTEYGAFPRSGWFFRYEDVMQAKVVDAVPREEYERVCKERDAAVSNLKQSFMDIYTPCHWCKNNIDGQTCLKEKGFSFSMKCWEWRGLQHD